MNHNPKIKGREKGSVNKKNDSELHRLMDRKLRPSEFWSLVAELIRGIAVQGKDEKIYSKPPDKEAIHLWAEYRNGKPVTRQEIESNTTTSPVLLIPQQVWQKKPEVTN